MEKRRNPYWDNVKLILIFLVVLGHFLLPVRKEARCISALYFWIYLFHMPTFVFVSGYFSKSYVRKDGKGHKLAGYLALYLLFTVFLWVIKLILTRKFDWTVLYMPASAQWYMLGMFFWLLIIPVVSRFPFWGVFAVSMVSGLFAGEISSIGNYLALSRVIVFFPFFLLGYHCNGNDAAIFQRGGWKIKIMSAAVLLIPLFVLYIHGGKLPRSIGIIYGRQSYQALRLSAGQGILFRFAWYGLAALMGAAFLCLIPNRTLKITPVGERTLGIYFVHRLIREVFRNLNLYQYMGSGWILLLSCLAVSLVVMYISSAKVITRRLNQLFELGVAGGGK